MVWSVAIAPCAIQGAVLRICRAFYAHLALTAQPQTDLSQGAHAHEVVGSHGHGEEQADLLDPAHHHLTNRTNELAPTKALFNELALFLRDGVASLVAMASGTADVLPDLFCATWGTTFFSCKASMNSAAS